jgi:hypothetical protein
MICITMPWWVVFLIPSKIWFVIYAIGLAIVSTISAWIVGIHMRRRVKADLGITADEGDLTSLETWMKVDEFEEEKNPGREWVPDAVDLGPDDQRRIDLFPKKKDNGPLS